MNAKIKDPKLNNKEVMIGYCNRDGITAGEFGVYFESQYDIYKPAEKYINKLREGINKVDIKIIFGTWCSDSKIQVPRFYKVLDQSGFKEKNLKIIGVNRDKNALSVNIMDLNIELVPTFIIYQNGEELGRIIETPKKTLEKDLAKIIAKAK
jgi:thiol-disulfide isomerase/thioredoxin